MNKGDNAQKLLDQSHQPIRAQNPHAKLSKNGPIFVNGKMPEFFEKSPFSGTGKHRDFQVTS